MIQLVWFAASAFGLGGVASLVRIGVFTSYRSPKAPSEPRASSMEYGALPTLAMSLLGAC